MECVCTIWKQSEKTFEGNTTVRRARDIKDVIEALQLAPVIIVAWSRGGRETLSYVDHFGNDAIRAVVLVDSVLMRTADGNTMAEFLVEARALQDDRKTYTEESARALFMRPHSEEFYKRIVQANLKTPTAVAVALLADDRQFDYRPVLKKVNRPVLFASRGDTSTPAAQMVEVEIPSARIESFPGSGHALFLDDPTRFNAVLGDFLRSLGTR